MTEASIPSGNACGLGIDAGGTKTRWALAGANGDIIASGEVAGLTALQMSTDVGMQHIRGALSELASAVLASGRPVRVYAGLTGSSGGDETLRKMIATAIGVDTLAVTIASDIEITFLDLYAPGEGYVVYAGTGSIAAFIDAAGTLHRAGGHGVMLDDAGGGFWIAREALRLIWRKEDEQPGSWRDSPMAQEIFKRIGGSDWAHTRQFVYGTANEAARGEIGKLALAVASVADTDPAARRILESAGQELARLAHAMTSRFGTRPVTLAGRVAQLHPAIKEAMRASLPESTRLDVKTSEGHCAAARIAARGASV